MKMENDVKILNLDDILPNRFQPRITFNEQAILELADSIKEHGVIQPIIVRKIADKFEIIAGERRYKASVLAGKTTIPAIVVDLNDKDSAEIALIENVQRQGLTPIEEAVSYKKILDMGYLNQSELATKLGKNQSTIANKLRLLNLSDEVQDALLKERISERHARSLLKLDKSKQNLMLERIINERLTVRKTDEEIRKMLENDDESDETSEEKKLNQIKKEGNDNMEPNVNNVNMPATPIQDNTVNPGFMDVSKIESQARDINSVGQAPVESTEVPSASIFSTPAPEPVQAESLASTNVPPVDNQAMMNNIPATPVFGGQAMEMPANAPTNMMPNPTEVSNNIPPIANPEPAVGTDFNPMPSALVSGGKFFNFPTDDNNNNMTNQNINNNPTFDTPNNTQAMPMPENNQINPVASLFENSQASMQTPETYPNQPMYNQTIPNEPIVNPGLNNQDNMVNQPMPNQMNFNPNQSLVEIGGSGVALEEPVLQPVMQTANQPQKADLKEAIMLIRNCADKIESMGFTIDVEELDFENSYQVSFKINKD